MATSSDTRVRLVRNTSVIEHGSGCILDTYLGRFGFEGPLAITVLPALVPHLETWVSKDHLLSIFSTIRPEMLEEVLGNLVQSGLVETQSKMDLASRIAIETSLLEWRVQCGAGESVMGIANDLMRLAKANGAVVEPIYIAFSLPHNTLLISIEKTTAKSETVFREPKLRHWIIVEIDPDSDSLQMDLSVDLPFQRLSRVDQPGKSFSLPVTTECLIAVSSMAYVQNQVRSLSTHDAVRRSHDQTIKISVLCNGELSNATERLKENALRNCEELSEEFPERLSGIWRESAAQTFDSRPLRFSDCDQIELPDVQPVLNQNLAHVLIGRKAQRQKRCELTDLATLLSLTTGFYDREGVRQRWCASAGSLGATELLVISRGTNCLNDGVYLYSPGEHGLRKLSHLSISALEHTILSTSKASGDGTLLVLFAGSDGALRPKYKNFTAKLLQLDLGVAAGQFILVANALGIRVQSFELQDDAFADRCLGMPTCGYTLNLAFQINVERKHLSPTVAVRTIEDTAFGARLTNWPQTFSVPEKHVAIRRFRLSLANKCLEMIARRQAEMQLKIALAGSNASTAGVLGRRQSRRSFSNYLVPFEQVERLLHASASLCDLYSSSDVLSIVVYSRASTSKTKSYASLSLANGKVAMLSSVSSYLPLHQEELREAPGLIVLRGRSIKGVYSGNTDDRKRLMIAGTVAHLIGLAADAIELGTCIVAGLDIPAFEASIGVGDAFTEPLIGVLFGVNE